jgi:hypothetical protein
MEDITRKQYYKQYYLKTKPKYETKGPRRKFEKPDIPEPIKIKKSTVVKFD